VATDIPGVERAERALSTWVRLLHPDHATEVRVLSDGRQEDALELMTAELFDATPWAALVVAIDRA
jgi:hypothetical protein